MKKFILIPEGQKGGESIIVKSLEDAKSALQTTDFFIRKAWFDGTPINGYFVDESLTDEFGIPFENIKAETDILCRIYINKKGKKLEKWLKEKMPVSKGDRDLVGYGYTGRAGYMEV